MGEAQPTPPWRRGLALCTDHRLRAAFVITVDTTFSGRTKGRAGTPKENSEEIPAPDLARPRGFEPLAFGFVVRRRGESTGPKASQCIVTPRNSEGRRSQPSQPITAFRRPFATPLLRTIDGQPSELPGLLTVQEAAEALRVCRATIYRLCAAGKLPHIRVSNAIRIPVAAIDKLST